MLSRNGLQALSSALSSRVLPLVVALFVALTSVSVMAEKSKFKYTKKMGVRQTLSVSTLRPGDAPDHEMTQTVWLDIIDTTDREYSGAMSLVYDHSDQVGGTTSLDGTGSHRGWNTDTLKNGDKVFMKYAGTHKMTTKAVGAWEVTGEGRFDIVGGTGKYKNAKGSGPYRFRVTPEGYFEEGEQEWEY